MDTPGFDDEKISDADILKLIATSLVDAFNDEADIQGALYVHPVTEARMRGSGRKNLTTFKMMLGMKSMSHCRLVTSKWSLQPDSVSTAREQELCEQDEFWKPLITAGAQTVRFRDNMQSAIEIIKPLVHGPTFKPLLIEEVVEEQKALPQTQAGQVVADDVQELQKAHTAEIENLKVQELKFREARDKEFEELVRAERQGLEAKVRQLEKDKLVLAEPIVTKSSGRFGRWIARGCAAAVGAVMTVVSGGMLAPAAMLLYGATETGAQIHRSTR